MPTVFPLAASGVQYYSWATGVRIRANLSQLEDWATQNGLEDEFGQMFERLLAASELLATSKNKLVKVSSCHSNELMYLTTYFEHCVHCAITGPEVIKLSQISDSGLLIG